MDTNGHTSLYEDYVSFETAKLLKEKGFEDDFCHTAYDCNGEFFWYGDYSKDRKGIMDAPTLQMAMKWLREVHHLHISVEMGFDVDYHQFYFFVPSVCKFSCKGGEYQTPFGEKEFYTYEKAGEAAIKYCLENLI